MKWIYHYKRQWINEDSSPLQSVYLRPVMFNKDKAKMVGKIIDLDLIAVEYFMKSEFKDLQKEQSIGEIYFKELKNKDYYFKEIDIEENDLYLCKCSIYIKEEMLTRESLLEWIKVYFNIKGIEFSEFEETDFNDFADTNPLFRMMTEGAKKMEDVWGKDWWEEEDDT